MGCWNETCAVTNLPILSGEACVMVVFESRLLLKENDWQLEDILQLLLSWPNYLVAVYKGTYNDYGYLNEAPKLKETKERGKHTGPADYPIIFIKEFIWKELSDNKTSKNFERLKKINRAFEIMGDSFLKIEGNFLNEFLLVLEFCYNIRKHPFSGLFMRGSQHGETAPYKKLIEFTKTGIKQVESHYKD